MFIEIYFGIFYWIHITINSMRATRFERWLTTFDGVPQARFYYQYRSMKTHFQINRNIPFIEWNSFWMCLSLTVDRQVWFFFLYLFVTKTVAHLYCMNKHQDRKIVVCHHKHTILTPIFSCSISYNSSKEKDQLHDGKWQRK